jgi:predicted metal-dependent enzyme (double-stranded beta helix superfamily)
LRDLIAHDDWLSPEHTIPGEDRYRQYLLYRDPQERFSVISFVWGPGQKTPVHDHTVWGLVGVMRGAERCSEYDLDASGRAVSRNCEHILEAGDVEAVSPTVGDVHVVANALADKPSISIHVYGADIGRVKRHWYDAGTGEPRDFVSGYSNA